MNNNQETKEYNVSDSSNQNELSGLIQILFTIEIFACIFAGIFNIMSLLICQLYSTAIVCIIADGLWITSTILVLNKKISGAYLFYSTSFFLIILVPAFHLPILQIIVKSLLWGLTLLIPKNGKTGWKTLKNISDEKANTHIEPNVSETEEPAENNKQTDRLTASESIPNTTNSVENQPSLVEDSPTHSMEQEHSARELETAKEDHQNPSMTDKRQDSKQLFKSNNSEDQITIEKRSGKFKRNQIVKISLVFLVIVAICYSGYLLWNSNLFVQDERNGKGIRYCYYEENESTKNIIVHFNKHCYHIKSNSSVYRKEITDRKNVLPCAYCTTPEEWNNEINRIYGHSQNSEKSSGNSTPTNNVRTNYVSTVNEANLSKLYGDLIDKFDLGSYEEYKQKMDNEELRKSLYDAITKKIKDTNFGTWEEFNEHLGYTLSVTRSPNKKAIKRLYDEIKGEYKVGSIEEFEKYLSNEDNRRLLYVALQDSQIDYGTWEEFNNCLFPIDNKK